MEPDIDRSQQRHCGSEILDCGAGNKIHQPVFPGPANHRLQESNLDSDYPHFVTSDLVGRNQLEYVLYLGVRRLRYGFTDPLGYSIDLEFCSHPGRSESVACQLKCREHWNWHVYVHGLCGCYLVVSDTDWRDRSANTAGISVCGKPYCRNVHGPSHSHRSWSPGFPSGGNGDVHGSSVRSPLHLGISFSVSK